MSWIPYVNGFEGIYQERENRFYIKWRGCDVTGGDEIRNLRVDNNTKEKIIEGLENA